MYNLDAIESIDFEQLATATDRMLLRGRPSKRRSAPTGGHRIASTAVGGPPLRTRLVPVALLASLFSVTTMIVALF